jgi:heme exporter protein D
MYSCVLLSIQHSELYCVFYVYLHYIISYIIVFITIINTFTLVVQRRSATLTEVSGLA